MPIYEYRCSKCQKIDQVLQKMTDPKPEVCSHCGAQDTLSKIISQSAFQLKGSGWYVTDFKNKPQPNAKASDSEGANASAGSDAPKADEAKPAAQSTPSATTSSQTESSEKK